MPTIKQIIKSLDSRISSLQEDLSSIRAALPSLQNELLRSEQEEKKRRLQCRGKFEIGQVVQWQENRNKTTLTGTIIGIVPAEKYPTNNGLEWGRKLTTLRYRGYYRYEESYIVESPRGKQYWPRTNSLHLLSENNNE